MESCCRIAELGCKEVVSVCDGARLGFVEDVEIDTCTGRLVSLVVPAAGGGLGSLLGKGEEYIIPWECIQKIGEDIVLVQFVPPPAPPVKKSKPRRFG